MDVHIGDLHSLIVDREIEIVQGLLTEILVYYEDMTESCDVCAELDWFVSPLLLSLSADRLQPPFPRRRLSRLQLPPTHNGRRERHHHQRRLMRRAGVIQ